MHIFEFFDQRKEDFFNMRLRYSDWYANIEIRQRCQIYRSKENTEEYNWDDKPHIENYWNIKNHL